MNVASSASLARRNWAGLGRELGGASGRRGAECGSGRGPGRALGGLDGAMTRAASLRGVGAVTRARWEGCVTRARVVQEAGPWSEGRRKWFPRFGQQREASLHGRTCALTLYPRGGSRAATLTMFASHRLGGPQSKIEVWAALVPLKDPLPGSQGRRPLCPHGLPPCPPCTPPCLFPPAGLD